MNEPKFEVPVELRDMAEKAIDQSEKAFDMFFGAASKSIEAVPTPALEMSRKSFSFAEENMKAVFDHARKLVRASDPQEAIQIQSEFLKNHMTTAGDQMKQIAEGIASAAKDATEGKFRDGSSN